MVNVAIVRRANEHELTVSLTLEDFEKFLPGVPLKRDDEIRVAYYGNAADGITLFPTDNKSRDFTRTMKCLASKTTGGRNGGFEPAFVRVWLPPKNIGTVKQFRPPTAIHLRIEDGKLRIPPLAESWHGPNIDAVKRLNGSRESIVLRTLEQMRPYGTPDAPPPPADDPDTPPPLDEAPAAEPEAEPPPPTPTEIHVIAIEDHIDRIVPASGGRLMSGDARRDSFRRLAEHLAFANRAVDEIGDEEIELAIEHNRVTVRRIYRPGVRRRKTQEPAA